MKIWIIIILSLFSISIKGEIRINWDRVKEETINLKSFASGIEYVALETTSECLLSGDCRYYLTEKYIVVASPFDAAYLFERKDGRFIHKITQRGQGPNEFSIDCGYEYGLKNNILYINNGSSWKGLDILSQKVVETIKKPVYVYDGKYNAIKNPWPFQDSLYWGYVNNITGSVGCKLVLFNRLGEVVKEIPNYVFYEKKSQDMPFFWGMFYEYNHSTYFKQYQGNDTVFVLNRNGVCPHIIFEWDKNQLIYQQMPIWTDNQIYISYINENDKYVFFDCHVNGKMVSKEIFYCFYDKRNQVLKSTRNHGAGFVDDIDGLGYFSPVISTNSELVDIVSAEKWLEWKDKGYRKSLDIDVKFDDNPILRIVHIK